MKKLALFSFIFIFAGIAGLAALGFAYRPSDGIPDGLKGRIVMINGNPMRIYQKGVGNDILMIHGVPGALEDWDPVIEDLAKDFRVTVYDRQGYGYSARGGTKYNLESNAQTALAIIRELDLKNTVVVGHSYGSATSLALAIQNPPEVRAFVLCASPGYPEVHPTFWDYILSVPYFGEGMMRLLSRSVGPQLVEAGIKSGFDPNQNLIPEGFIALREMMWLRPQVMTTRAREYTRLEKDLARISPHYKDIKKKVYLVQGKSDEITKAAWKLHEDIPGSELTEFEGAGHFVQFAHPRETAAVIRRAGKI